MAELDGIRHGECASRTPTSATAKQVLHDTLSSGSTSTPTFGKNHDLDDDHSHHHKKLSVLAKVKEKAKKWRLSLTRKKHGNHTPSWGVALEDDQADEDAEYIGAPMYESELAPDGYKEHAKQHPREDIVMPEKHVLNFSTTNEADQEKEIAPPSAAADKNDHAGTTKIIAKDQSPLNPAKKTIVEGQEGGLHKGKIAAEEEKQKLPSLEEATSDSKEKSPSSGKTITETVTEKLAPAYATISEATYAVASKIQEMASSMPLSPAKKMMAEEQGNPAGPSEEEIIAAAEKQKHPCLEKAKSNEGKIVSAEEIQKLPSLEKAISDEGKETVTSPGKTITETMSDKLAPAYAAMSDKLAPAYASMSDKLAPAYASMTDKLAPAYATMSDATQAITSKIQEMSASILPDDSAGVNAAIQDRIWDKGVSVKEYIKNKLEPGEDEKALSQVISDAISPKKAPGDKGVVKKVKETVIELMQSEEETASTLKTSNSAELIPLSTSAHEVVEASQGRVLQAN